MKTLLCILLGAALSSCAVTLNPDGSKAVTVDGVVLAKVINDKATEILNDK